MTDVTADTPQGGEPAAAPWPSASMAWYAVFILFLMQTVNFLDRQIVALLVEPIKGSLNLSDTQMGLILGFAYTFLYVFLGLPIARIVDHTSRRRILALGATLWGVMTAACGFAKSFWALYFCRVGVGVGEACTGPAAFSLLADLFPREKLSRAIAVMNFGYAAGNGVALLFGGTVILLVAQTPEVTLPVLGDFWSWQVVFLIAGIPGLIVALLMATMREPARRGQVHLADGRPSAPSIREVLSFLRSEWRTFAPIIGGATIKALITFGGALWIVTFFIRTYGMTAPQISLVYGIFWLTLAPIGAMVGTSMAERFIKAGRDSAYMLVVLVSSVVGVCVAVALPLMPSPELAFVFLGLQVFTGSWVLGPQNAALQVVTPNQMRAQVSALYLFLFNVVGFGLGPTCVALLTDYVYGADEHLRYSLATLPAVLGPIACVVIWWGLKHYATAVERAKSWS